MYVEYICNIFSRRVVSIAWEMFQKNFDTMCNYTEFFYFCVWAVDFLRGVVYK